MAPLGGKWGQIAVLCPSLAANTFTVRLKRPTEPFIHILKMRHTIQHLHIHARMKDSEQRHGMQRAAADQRSLMEGVRVRPKARNHGSIEI